MVANFYETLDDKGDPVAILAIDTVGPDGATNRTELRFKEDGARHLSDKLQAFLEHAETFRTRTETVDGESIEGVPG